MKDRGYLASGILLGGMAAYWGWILNSHVSLDLFKTGSWNFVVIGNFAIPAGILLVILSLLPKKSNSPIKTVIISALISYFFWLIIVIPILWFVLGSFGINIF